MCVQCRSCVVFPPMIKGCICSHYGLSGGWLFLLIDTCSKFPATAERQIGIAWALFYLPEEAFCKEVNPFHKQEHSSPSAQSGCNLLRAGDLAISISMFYSHALHQRGRMTLCLCAVAERAQHTADFPSDATLHVCSTAAHQREILYFVLGYIYPTTVLLLVTLQIKNRMLLGC